MKKNRILFISILICSSIVSGAQEKIHFKIGFMPGKKYHLVSKSNQVYNVTYDGPQHLLDSLKAIGESTTKELENETSMESDVLTEHSLDAKGEFKVAMSLNRLKIAGDSETFSHGIRLFGKCAANSTIRFDSLEADGFTKEVRTQMLPVIQKMFAQITFPEKDLNIGESFVHEQPFNFPVGSRNVIMQISTKYTLVSINNSIANLAIKQNYTMTSNEGYTSLTASGDGVGEMLFDIANFYLRKYLVNISMKMHVKTDKAEVTQIITSVSEQRGTVSAN